MKPQLLETTRLLLAVERAADLGVAGVDLASLAHDFGLSTEALKSFLVALDDTADSAASPDELVDWEIDEAGILRVFYAPGLDREIPLGGDEASALLIGLDRLGLSQDRLASLQRRLLARLGAADAERLLQLRSRLAIKPEHQWRAAIETAIESASGLRILYESSSARRWRRLLPSALVDHLGRLYVGAWCFEQRAPRLFRADRIFDLSPWEVDLPVGELPDREALIKRLATLTDGHLAERIVLRCADDDGLWMLQEYFGPQIKHSKGRLVVQDYPGQSLANWIVSCAGSVVVESPAALVERVRERARMVARLNAGVDRE